VTLAASIGVHLLDRGEPVTLVTEDGARLTGSGASGSRDAVLDALASLRPSARTDLGGPPLPGAGDLVAVLGATTPEELAQLARRAGGGHAVLLDVDSWNAAPEGTSPAATAAALRAAGWVVAVAARGTAPERVWDELVAAPAPQAGTLGAHR
jgi:hypothetical protein